MSALTLRRSARIGEKRAPREFVVVRMCWPGQAERATVIEEEQQSPAGRESGDTGGSLEWLERNRSGVVLVLLVLTAVALGLYALQLRNTAPIEITPVQTELRDIRVYVTGAVAQPGVYAANTGERVGDVVARAGGLTAEADPVAINLARRTRDEMHIHVPAKGEARSATGSGAAPSPLAPLNLNTASQSDLEALPGIGEVTARRILASREADGPFGNVDDLQRAGVRLSVIEQIRNLVVAE